jgi:hypothetical protein
VYLQGTAKTLEYLRAAESSGVGLGRQTLKSYALMRKFSDVEFVVGSTVLPAHKAILRARSPVMRALLQSTVPLEREGDEKHLVEIRPPAELSDLTIDAFREFISYLYSDTVEKEKFEVNLTCFVFVLLYFARRMTVVLIGT